MAWGGGGGKREPGNPAVLLRQGTEEEDASVHVQGTAHGRHKIGYLSAHSNLSSPPDQLFTSPAASLSAVPVTWRQVDEMVEHSP